MGNKLVGFVVQELVLKLFNKFLIFTNVNYSQRRNQTGGMPPCYGGGLATTKAPTMNPNTGSCGSCGGAQYDSGTFFNAIIFKSNKKSNSQTLIIKVF